MKIARVIETIEAFAPLALQESFDNSGLQVGDPSQEVRGILLCLDVTEDVIDEAIALDCNLVISHHPLLFKALNSVTTKTYIERCVAMACKHDVVIYAAHTNLDNAPGGVNYRLAEQIGLQNIRFLKAFPEGNGGSGVIGELPIEDDETAFLERVKDIMHLQSLQHSAERNRPVRTVALCGGSGAFLLPDAIAAGADVFLTGEARYNDFYNAEDRILLAVLGHYETEICTKELFFEIISQKMPNFAIHLSSANTNPVNYM